MPAFIISLYKESIRSAALGVEPEVTLRIVESLCSLSPGLILSGLYPTKKFLLNLRPEIRSNTGTQSSSVAPGYTVDSYITRSPSLRTFPTVSEAPRSGERSGRLLASIGVGTVIM